MNELASRRLPADRCPARVYLASLAPTGRRAQETALRTCAELLAPRVAPEDVPWEALRYQHVAAVRAVLVDRGLAPSTVNRHLAALRSVVREAWRLGLCSLEELARVREVQGVRGSRLPAGRMLEREELSALLEHGGQRERAAVALMYGAGLRVAEACSVQVEDLDDARESVRVVGKGNVEAIAPLPPRCYELVVEWIEGRRGGWWPGAILTRYDRRGLHPNSLADALQRVAKRAGVACTAHDLRRTFVSALLLNGTDLATTQRLARHEDPRTTARYDRRPELARRAAVRSIDL